MTIRGWTVHAPSSNTLATASTTAQTKGKHLLADVLFGYNAAPTNGTLKITDGTTDIIVPVTDAGPGRVPAHFLPFESFAQITVELAAGGVGVTGWMNIRNGEPSING